MKYSAFLLKISKQNNIYNKKKGNVVVIVALMLAHIGDKSDFPQFLLWQQHLTVLLLMYCIDFSKKNKKNKDQYILQSV